MTEREQIVREIREETIRAMKERFALEKELKLRNYRELNKYAKKGRTLFTGSSLMEQFPIVEFCQSEGLAPVYNRGIGGYTTDEFLDSIDTVLLDLQPSTLFINIGTNDIRTWPNGEDWLARLAGNLRTICTIIRDRLPGSVVYMMAYYPVNPDAPGAKDNLALRVRTNENIARANRMAEKLADEFGFRYIDVNDGLKNEQGRLLAAHTMDGMHFDAAAYRTVFERLKGYLG